MKLTDEGLDLIKRNEGCRLESYQDVGGVWTIGFGHTGAEVVSGLVWTQQQADEQLNKDLLRFETGVEDLLAVSVNDNQFSALVSLAYNIGLGNLARSGLLKKVNDENFTSAAASFLLWNKASGKIVDALTKRREEERQLFLS
jgi:lysozyme